MPAIPDLSAGARVQFKGAIGTVCFVGPLDGHPSHEHWVGVEWDDPNRGKHSGTYNGVHYFSTAVPNAASFVKRDKLATRITLLDAAQARFADATDHSHRTAPTLVQGKVFDIEEEGRHIHALADIDELDVSFMCVCAIDRPSLRDTLPRLRKLYMTRSLLTHVDQIVDILDAFPTLELLDASRNVLRDHPPGANTQSSVVAELPAKHASLQELILNHCSVSWQGIHTVCARVRALRQLRLHNCGLRSFAAGMGDSLSAQWAALQLLDLDENTVSWADVRALSRLRDLRDLYVSGNALEDCDGATFFATSGTAVIPFTALRTLSVERNRLSGWAFLTWLHTLPELRHLRASGNAGLEQQQHHQQPRRQQDDAGQTTYRMRTIGRIGNLTRLDGSAILVDERLQAERWYTRDEVLPAVRTSGMKAAAKEHPRAYELLSMFSDTVGFDGAADGTGRGADARVLTMRHAAIRCTLRATGRGLAAKRVTVTRVLPASITGEQMEVVAKTVLRVADRQTRVRVVVCVVDKSEDGGSRRTMEMTDGVVLGAVVGKQFDSVSVHCEASYEQ